MRCRNMLTSYRELKTTGSQLHLLLKYNKGVSAFLSALLSLMLLNFLWNLCDLHEIYQIHGNMFRNKINIFSIVLEIFSPYEHVWAVLLGK